VDSVPDSLLLRKSGSPGNRTPTSGSVARNSDLSTTEAVSVSNNKMKSKNVEQRLLAVQYECAIWFEYEGC
jgi:hypothetical protein